MTYEDFVSALNQLKNIPQTDAERVLGMAAYTTDPDRAILYQKILDLDSALARASREDMWTLKEFAELLRNAEGNLHMLQHTAKEAAEKNNDLRLIEKKINSSVSDEL